MATLGADFERLAASYESAAHAAPLENRAQLEAATAFFHLIPAVDALGNLSACAAAALLDAQGACARAQAICRGKFDINLLVADSETVMRGKHPRSKPAIFFSPSRTLVSQVEAKEGLDTGSVLKRACHISFLLTIALATVSRFATDTRPRRFWWLSNFCGQGERAGARQPPCCPSTSTETHAAGVVYRYVAACCYPERCF
jgi:hypothetical protein